MLTVIVFFVFCGRFGDVIIDSYRELYIPQQIIEGGVLYQNIFMIYPPLSYLINSLLIKVFGNAQLILNFAGLFFTLGIIYFTHKIAQKFIDKNFCLGINLFIISGLVLSPNVFNAFFPYSYGILYGILFVLISINFALNKKYTLMYLFYSLAVLCKYEFILLLPLLIYQSKFLNWKKNLLVFLLPVIFTMSVLFIQGLRFDDIKISLNLVGIMSSSKTLYWFYSVMGLTFRFEHLPIYLTNIVKFLFPINWTKYQEVLIWVYPVVALAFVLRFKNFNYIEKFFILASLLVSLKVFFALTLQSYGVYFLPFALISLFIVIPQNYRKILFTLLILWSFIIGFFNINVLINKKVELNPVVEYVKSHTDVNDKVLVYPECLAINVFSGRKSDNKFYSLIPLYVETLGEELIIKRFELTQPKYIIINNYDTSAYYFREFGRDYAQDVFKWIEKNYTLKATINDTWIFKVYELN